MNPLIHLAEAYLVFEESEDYSSIAYRDRINDLHLALEGEDHETLYAASARTAYEASLTVDLLFQEQPRTASMISRGAVTRLIWDLPQFVREYEMNRVWPKVAKNNSQILRLTAALSVKGEEFGNPEQDYDFGWLHEVLGEIEAEIDSASFGPELKRALGRQVRQVRYIAEKDPVDPNLVARALASLAGLLSAAAQSEPKREKAKTFMKWSLRIASGILIDVMTGFPSQVITEAMILAIEQSGGDSSNGVPTDDAGVDV